MPVYPMVCPFGHKFDDLRPAARAKERVKCPTCRLPSRQDWQAKRVQGHVDGEHSGYYPADTGFPVDPKNPNKRICPARGKARDAFSRLADETQGGMTFE